ncbi:hypothetical protein M440DRAFT_1405088 [Trichoderma longibrachiatum ATCC 18648]|uniref:Uncharacterized protein n=1 Tax=Trichoderma longibrachiatum ATCC 18648 TaxID=983965 RepID=A0A2T4BTL1_TRILO|nr:hypothetical protein M440DRAFT_1405088 [Trichoderma longibrachiatum ATCC 18648]
MHEGIGDRGKGDTFVQAFSCNAHCRSGLRWVSERLNDVLRIFTQAVFFEKASVDVSMEREASREGASHGGVIACLHSPATSCGSTEVYQPSGSCISKPSTQ